MRKAGTEAVYLADSGRITGTWQGGGGHRLLIDWVQEPDVANLCSTIRLTFRIEHASMNWANARNASDNSTAECSGCGEAHWHSAYWNMYDDHLTVHELGSASFTVPAQADGTHEPVTIGAKYYYSFGGYEWITASARIRPDKLRLAGKLGNVPGYIEIGETMTIPVEITSPEYEYEVYLSINGTTLRGWAGEGLRQVTVTYPLLWLNYITDAMTGTAEVTLKTYDSDMRQVGATDTKYVTVRVPPGMVPHGIPGRTAFTPYGVNDGTSLAGHRAIVAGVSYLTAEFNERAVETCYGAPLAGRAIECCGMSASADTGEEAPRIGPVMAAGVYPCKMTFTDSRGGAYTETRDVTVYAWDDPVITDVEMYRCDANGARDSEGTYLYTRASAQASRIIDDGVSVNDVTITARYREVGSGAWTELPLTDGIGAVTAGLSVNRAYEVRIEARDTLGKVTKVNGLAAKGPVAMNFRPGGDGVSFGEYGSRDGFRCKWDAEFMGEVELSGITAASGVVMEVTYADDTTARFILAGREDTPDE